MIDAVDRQIVEALMADARTPFSKIAKKIGVSTQTVARRYNQMRQTEAIQQISIALDLGKLGYKGMATLLITCASGSNLPEVIAQLKKSQNIVIATTSVGDYEGYAILVFKDAKDLYERIQQVKRIPSIASVDFTISSATFTTYPPNLKLLLK